jgi:putative membrane protein
MNKDLVLREHLAIERTKLANENTLLAYVRTGLYFVVAGSTLGELVNTSFWRIAGTPLILIGAVIVIAGVVRYRKTNKVIEKSRHNVGNATDDFVRSIKGV